VKYSAKAPVIEHLGVGRKLISRRDAVDQACTPMAINE